MMNAVTLLLAALACARLTRLVTTDKLTEPLRLRVLTWIVRRALDKERDPEESLLAYLVTCSWCVSVYVGAGTAGAWAAWGDQRWFTAVCAALAFSYVTGALAARESEA